MRKLLLILASVVALSGCATMYTPDTRQPMDKYEKVVDIPNVKQEMIYEGSRQWIAKSFNSANAVIQYQDKATGTVIGKGNMAYPCASVYCMSSSKPMLKFTMQVDSKDSKARVSFSDFMVDVPESYNALTGKMAGYNYQIKSDEDKAKTVAILDSTINSMVEDIKKTNTTDKNW